MRPRSASAARTREALRDAVQIYAPSTVYAVGLGAMTPALAVAALALGLDAARAAAVVLLVGLGSLVANGPASALAARAGISDENLVPTPELIGMEISSSEIQQSEVSHGDA